MRARNDVGETLIEIVLTIVIVGLAAGALLSSLATAGNAGNAQRRSVQVDYVLRNYAVAAKVGVQNCITNAKYDVTYLAPTGFSVSGVAAIGNNCPLASTTQPLTLTVTQVSSGFHDSMDIRVRTP